MILNSSCISQPHAISLTWLQLLPLGAVLGAEFSGCPCQRTIMIWLGMSADQTQARHIEHLYSLAKLGRLRAVHPHRRWPVSICASTPIGALPETQPLFPAGRRIWIPGWNLNIRAASQIPFAGAGRPSAVRGSSF